VALINLTNKVAKQNGVSQDVAKAIVADLFAELKNEVSEGNDVLVSGFGTFKWKHRAERKGRNPSTGEEMLIKASDVMTFKASKKKVVK